MLKNIARSLAALETQIDRLTEHTRAAQARNAAPTQDTIRPPQLAASSFVLTWHGDGTGITFRRSILIDQLEAAFEKLQP
jgi:hypothetical protein